LKCVSLALSKAAWDNDGTHAVAVRNHAIPSKQGLLFDQSHPAKCSECNLAYLLHYDEEAEVVFTLCGIWAEEIVTARHPEHAANVVLDPVALDRAQPGKTQLVWSTRISAVQFLKKPDPRQERFAPAAGQQNVL
jgi:hypothetical protein